jgi:acyl-[acyl-carrier-protein] desaturase
MAQMCAAVVPEPDTVPDALSYVALQELATRVSHWNTGKLLTDKVGTDIMARVAADENLHYLFYRDLVTAALELEPSRTMCAITRQALEFEMPGVGIIDFSSHAAAIARAGIYDFAIHHEQILCGVVLRHWKVESLTGLSADAERARDTLMVHIDRVGRVGRRFAERRAEAVAV